MTEEQRDLLVLAETRGVSLTINDHGEHVGSCPFCTVEDALTIDAEAQSWRCTGRCQDGGGLVEWVARARGVSRRHARELVRAGLPEGRDAPPGGRYSRQKGVVATACTRRWLDGEFDPDASDGHLLSQVTAFYHANLESNPEATGYLERRGLGDPELIEHFQLGYSNRTLGYRLPSGNRKLGAALRGRLRQVGVYRPNGREHLSG